MNALAKSTPPPSALLLRLLAGTATQADCVAAAHALELARTLFVMAATQREQAAETNACGKYGTNAPQTIRAGQRVEKRRAEAVAHFNKATGLDK